MNLKSLKLGQSIVVRALANRSNYKAGPARDHYSSLTFTIGDSLVEMVFNGRQWAEGRVLEGDKPANWGSKKYQSYLSVKDILYWLSKDYDDVTFESAEDNGQEDEED